MINKLKTLLFCAAFTFIAAFPAVTQLFADVGGDSPDGVVGRFSGVITTGSGYSAYTGNVIRSITDMTVRNTVGDYPLTLARTYNSRDNSWGWSFSLIWPIRYSAWVCCAPPTAPSSYPVTFPDGRTEVFSLQGTEWKAAAGTFERFSPRDPNTSLAYLLLPDGGKVEFLVTLQNDGDQPIHYWWEFKAQGVIDPHGLRTNFTRDPTSEHVTQVTEPGGKFLQISYRTTTPVGVVDHVTSSDGRVVTYGYSQIGGNYWYLTSAAYSWAPQATATYRYTSYPGTSLSLLWTANEPLYPGPMKRIAYDYATGTNPDGSQAVFGQVLNERYWDGQNGHESGAWSPIVSTLTVDWNHGNPVLPVRIETRQDGKTRRFTYEATGGYLTNVTDWMGHGSSQVFDSITKYVTSTTDANGHTTNFTRDSLGHITQVMFPASSAATPQPDVRGTINYAYDGYYLHTIQDEAGNITTFVRDSNHRVIEIDYGNPNADDGYETFGYSNDGLGQITTHQIKTGGTESFAYDSSHRLQYYSDPYHTNPTNYSVFFNYDSVGRVNVTYDALGRQTNWDYNDTNNTVTVTLPTDPVDGQRHTIVKTFNADRTLQRVVDTLNHTTSYAYDDYRRIKSVTTPGHNTPQTINLYYGANSTGFDVNDYQYADSNVTYVVLPSGKKTQTVYDDNRRKLTVTVAPGVSGEQATTTYSYDPVGNIWAVSDPKSQPSGTNYDERNRVMEVWNRSSQFTEIRYDHYGHQKQITRPNGQIVTFDNFDIGNRVTHQTVTQSPSPNAVTVYTYYGPNEDGGAPGLLKSMQDPRLVANGSAESYSYTYDLMGRQLTMAYPRPTPGASPTVETTHYDTNAGRVDYVITRNGKRLTPGYDTFGRISSLTWNDGTPTVSCGYDVASRVISVTNSNATDTYAYFNDGLLQSETQTIGPVSKTVPYTYDADSNRASMQYPDSPYLCQYDYTGRNQLKDVALLGLGNPHMTYTYDYNGNILSATIINNTHSSYVYDEMDRTKEIHHYFTGRQQDFYYGYDSATGNRLWTKRTGNIGDVFGYDLVGQAIAVKLQIASPDTTSVGSPTITYDASGNRIYFGPYGFPGTYSTNDLNQYTLRNFSSASYDTNGNMTTGLDSSVYTFDAENRVLTATKGGTSMIFTYDGLGRQVTRQVGKGATTYNIYDGWNLIEEQTAAGNLQAEYYYGVAGMLFSRQTGYPWTYYYQNGEGSTSQIADSSGNLLEWYWYDLQGIPTFYDASNQQITSSAFFIRHLFTGEQWYSELGLYDLRNRFYSPDAGRFIQADPTGFGGGDNMYRYCGNSPANAADPFGLESREFPHQTEDEHGQTTSLQSDDMDLLGGAEGPFFGVNTSSPSSNSSSSSSSRGPAMIPSIGNIINIDRTGGIGFYGFGGIGLGALSPGRNDASGAMAGGAPQTGRPADNLDALAKDQDFQNTVHTWDNFLTNYYLPVLSIILPPWGEGGAAAKATKATWVSPAGGRQVINGIEYSTHALERMAPKGLIQKGNQIVSRGVPPAVVENAIKYGKVSPGNTAAEVVRTYENVRVVTNPEGTLVITVITTGD